MNVECRIKNNAIEIVTLIFIESITGLVNILLKLKNYNKNFSHDQKRQNENTFTLKVNVKKSFNKSGKIFYIKLLKREK